jgi:4-hydroxy-tetrahydrodipicolinate reductase
MNEALKIGVGGALGRMGQAVAAVVRAKPGAVLVGGFDRPGATGDATEDAALRPRADILSACDVVVDFSTGSASADLAAAAAARGGPALVLGATGLSAAEDAAIVEASRRIAIVSSGNYSLGLNILAGLVEQAARRLGPEAWDIEVLETHHRRKVDAPSGTALMLASAAARGRGQNLSEVETPPRAGITGPRVEGAIGFASLRGGGVVGEHSVIFAAEEEVITLSHSARDRSLFARGAVEAAIWLAGRPAGLYDMADVLGFGR